MSLALVVLPENPQMFEIPSSRFDLLCIDSPTGDNISHTTRNLSSGSYG